MNVVGLDLSLTGTGIATPGGEVTLTTKARGMERLVELRARVLDEIGAYEFSWSPTDPGNTPLDTLVVIEGYSMGTARQSSHAHALGELGGVIRLALHEASVAYVDVPPASLKKYACGRGNANKEEVLVAAVRRLGYSGADNNQADALWLRSMGMDAMGFPLAVMPAGHRVALDAVRGLDAYRVAAEGAA